MDKCQQLSARNFQRIVQERGSLHLASARRYSCSFEQHLRVFKANKHDPCSQNLGSEI